MNVADERSYIEVAESPKRRQVVFARRSMHELQSRTLDRVFPSKSAPFHGHAGCHGCKGGLRDPNRHEPRSALELPSQPTTSGRIRRVCSRK
jgi:hypothetical protein